MILFFRFLSSRVRWSANFESEGKKKNFINKITIKQVISDNIHSGSGFSSSVQSPLSELEVSEESEEPEGRYLTNFPTSQHWQVPPEHKKCACSLHDGFEHRTHSVPRASCSSLSMSVGRTGSTSQQTLQMAGSFFVFSAAFHFCDCS